MKADCPFINNTRGPVHEFMPGMQDGAETGSPTSLVDYERVQVLDCERVQARPRFPTGARSGLERDVGSWPGKERLREGFRACLACLV